MVEIIESNTELKDQYMRIQTVPGVGKVLATMLIVKTNGFYRNSIGKEDGLLFWCCSI